MSAAQAAQAVEAPAAQAKRERRSFSVGFTFREAERLKITARQRKDGTATTHAVHSARDGKKWKHTRGATEKHASLAAARATQERLVAQALKAGWTRRERSGGFQARPDAFDAAHLPAPGGKTSRK